MGSENLCEKEKLNVHLCAIFDDTGILYSCGFEGYGDTSLHIGVSLFSAAEKLT